MKYLTSTKYSKKRRNLLDDYINDLYLDDVDGFLDSFLLFSFLFVAGDGDLSDSELSVEDDLVLLEEVDDELEVVPDDDSLSLDSLKYVRINY